MSILSQFYANDMYILCQKALTKDYFFYGTEVRSLDMLVNDSLTDSCLGNLMALNDTNVDFEL